MVRARDIAIAGGVLGSLIALSKVARAGEVTTDNAKGGLQIKLYVTGNTALAHAIAKVGGGTPPITTTVKVTVKDSNGNLIGSRSNTCTNQKVYDTCEVAFSWTYTPAMTYEVCGEADFKNQWGSDHKKSCTRWTAPGLPPTGTVTVVVR